MTQKEIIEKIKELKWYLQKHYNDDKLIELYKLIDLLKVEDK